MSDGDRLLRAVGIVLVTAFVAGLVLLVFVGSQADPETQEEPVTNWDAERINETHVRLIHAGGDPVDTGNVIVTVESEQRRVTWSETVFTGDTGVVRARAGETVELFWTPSPSADRTRMGSWEL